MRTRQSIVFGLAAAAAAKRHARAVRSVRARSPKHGRMKNKVARA